MDGFNGGHSALHDGLREGRQVSRDYTTKTEQRGQRIRDLGIGTAESQPGADKAAEVLALRARVQWFEENRDGMIGLNGTLAAQLRQAASEILALRARVREVHKIALWALAALKSNDDIPVNEFRAAEYRLAEIMETPAEGGKNRLIFDDTEFCGESITETKTEAGNGTN